MEGKARKEPGTRNPARKKSIAKAHSGIPSPSGAGHALKTDKWKDNVRAPVVEGAWDVFCGSIMQEVQPSFCLFVAQFAEIMSVDLAVDVKHAVLSFVHVLGPNIIFPVKYN